MSRCVVPGCLNLLQEWTTEFPRVEQLVNRWREAIQVGTGQTPAVHSDARICKAHFAIPSLLGDEDDDEYDDDADRPKSSRTAASRDKYQEPRLFFRDNTLTQVAECKLCLRFGIVDEMYKPTETIGGKETLHKLAQKYFNQPDQKNQSKAVKGYFCEGCVVHIDMVHCFWLRNHLAWKTYRKVRELMTSENVTFRSTGTRLKRNRTALVVLDSPPPAKSALEETNDVDENDVIKIDDDSNEASTDVDQLEDTIVKEETQLTESYLWESVPTLPPTEEISVKCFICDGLFENRQILTDHIAESHHRCRRVCNICNDEFRSALSYNDHMYTHNMFQCNHCPLQFHHRRDVVFHEITQHIGERVLKACDICGKLFRCRDVLNAHRNEHFQT
ncbi:uncharacterized protein LOC134226534 [Armigeres subalbatus]|uniref:uncharacterized protein LOC134226534 n=1 Tax=Armigeres subalbatus TaxID=124917 RepID=UPI002ED25D15